MDTLMQRSKPQFCITIGAIFLMASLSSMRISAQEDSNYDSSNGKSQTSEEIQDPGYSESTNPFPSPEPAYSQSEAEAQSPREMNPVPPPARIPKPPRRRGALSDTEREIVQRHRENASLTEKDRKNTTSSNRADASASLAKSSLSGRAINQGISQSPITELLSIDQVDQPIVDVLRAIGMAYKLSIVPDADVGAERVTIHLENVPVIEGLEKICRSRGLELVEDGNIYRVRKASETTISALKMQSKRLTLAVENQPVKQFIRDFVQKTNLNIIASQALSGNISGNLVNVLPIDGFKAIMSANNYSVRLKNGIYIVESDNAETAGMPGMRGRPRMAKGNSSFDIDISEGKVNLSLTEAPLADAVRQIAELAGLNVVLYGEVTGSVNAELRDVTVDEALVSLLNGSRYTYIRKASTLLIGDRNPNTPQGEALSDIQLHFLRYISAEDVLKIVPKSFKAEITVVKEQNALLVVGTSDLIERTINFLNSIDIPVPQVLFEIVVVEYVRDKGSKFGIKAGSSNVDGPNVNANINLVGANSMYTNGGFQSSIGIKPQNFLLHLEALESKSRAKVLAMPKLTTLNGNKASLKVSRTRYYARTDATKEGQPLLDYRAFDDGITINITPWVTQHGEVNVDINPVIKTSTEGQADAPPPITDRSIETKVRLLDGQTLALGGLIDSKETISRSFVPILGSIPFLGYLFSSRTKDTHTTELVIYVTPHVLRTEVNGVDLESELESLNDRGGALKDKDFLGTKYTISPKSIDDELEIDEVQWGETFKASPNKANADTSVNKKTSESKAPANKALKKENSESKAKVLNPNSTSRRSQAFPISKPTTNPQAPTGPASPPYINDSLKTGP